MTKTSGNNKQPPTARMANIKPSPGKESAADASVAEIREDTDVVKAEEATKDNHIEEIGEDNSEELREKKVKEIPLIEDLDLDEFFFTGILKHDFNIKKLKFTLRLLKAEELEETNEFLWKKSGENVSMDMLMLSHSIEILGRSIMSYGKMDLSEYASADKLEFVRNNVPGLIIPMLMEKYESLEYSASKALSEENLKN